MAMEIAGNVKVNDPSLSDGKKYPLRLDTAGNLKVVTSGGGGQTSSSGSTSVVPATDAGPSSVSRLLSSAASTNAAVVKASPGSVYKIRGNNTVASKRYLKLYNKATSPTVGTDTPVATFVLLASSSFEISLDALYFSAGIGYAITAAIADADTTIIGAGDIEALNIIYK